MAIAGEDSMRNEIVSGCNLLLISRSSLFATKPGKKNCAATTTATMTITKKAINFFICVIVSYIFKLASFFK